MKKLRIGIAGSVGHAEKFVRLINSYEESEVVVYCAHDEEGAEIASRLGLAHETDFNTMLANYHLDGVVITVTNSEKRDMVLAAAKAGVSIFLEKPLTASKTEALEMQAAVNAAGIRFYMSDPFVRSGIIQLKRLIQSGELGEITGASVRLASDRAFDGHHSPHIYNKALSQGGIMADVGCHVLHIIHYLFGKPASLCASLSSSTEDARVNAIEENAVTMLRYENGLTVSAEASWVSGGNSSYTAVYGTKGWARVVDLPGHEGNQQLTWQIGNGPVQSLQGDALPPSPTRHVRYFVEMIAYHKPNDRIGIDDDSNNGVSIDNAVELSEIIDAIYQAPNQGYVTL